MPIEAPALFLERLIGVTELDPKLATYAVVPSGVMAMASGCSPTPMALPALPVARLIGVTLSDPQLAT